jgi:hypothetical protein
VSTQLNVVAPKGQPWPVDLAAAEARLRQHWPSAHITREVGRVIQTAYLSFDVEINGRSRWGILEPTQYLSLREGSPADWAETIAWFVNQLPPGSAALAYVGENPDPAPIPPGSSADELRALYERLDDY